MKDDFKITPFDRQMYEELEKYESRDSHRSRGRGITIQSLADKLEITPQSILSSYLKLEALGICEVRSKNKVVLI